MASAVAGPEADSPASLADEVERVREAFTRLSGGSARGLVDASSRLQLEDERARFRVWAENIGAHHGPNDKRSLEHRLRHTPELLVSIAELLRELHGVLEEIENAAPEPRVDARGVEDEPSDTTTASQTELEELCLIVGDIITSLLRSSTLMRTATVRDRYARAAIAGKDYPFDPELDIRHVKDLYPKIAARPWLATRLGTAITRRRQFLRYSLEHRDRLAAEETAQPGTVEASGASQMLWSGQRPQTEASIKLDPPDLTLRHRATIAGTAATTVQAGAALGVDVRNLHLSTEDDLISESTSFVSSISASSDKIRVARLDSLSKAGSPFECPYCRGIVQFRNQTAWKRHVFQDLRAYVCTFRDCTAGLFQDRDAWFDHESSVHRRIWTCLSCEEKSFETADRLSNHFTTTHPSDLGAGDWALAAMVAASSRAMDRMPAISCPLCDDLAIQPDSQAERRDGKASSAAELTVPVGLFRRHLAGHLEQLALSAIPISFDDSKLSDSDSHTSDGDSDTPSGGSQQLGASLADDALIAHMQSRILQIFRRRYDATPEQVEIEGGCPGPWTLEFAKRVQWKWKPRDASSAVAALEKELWDATGQQEHLQPAAPGVPAEDRTYRISKEDLLLDGASWRELNGLIGLSSVKSIITAFAKEILFGQQSEVARTNTLFFLGPPGTGKHTVAKLYGKILFDLRLLSTDDTVCMKASELVGHSRDESERLTRDALARGNQKVLMIGDFDKLDNRLTPPEFFTAAVFATLVHELESTAAEDRCVIFAGPKGATETMLNTGSYGLGCRLSGIRLNFDALTDNELEDLEMLLLRAGKLNLQLSPDMIAAALAELQLARQVQREHFLHAHQIDHLLVMLRADTIRA